MLLKLENLLTADEVARLRKTLEQAQFVAGTVSGKATLKKNLQANQAAPEVQRASQAVIGALMRRREFTSYSIPKQVYLVFNRYDPGMEYKDHMDAAIMGPSQHQALRADLSFTVYLTDPDAYEGGEFLLQSPYGEIRIKEPAGNAIVYPSTMLHRVDGVTRGSRWAAVGWIQSFVRDTEQRQIVHQLDQLRHDLTGELPESAYPERFAAVYQNLMRMWAEV